MPSSTTTRRSIVFTGKDQLEFAAEPVPSPKAGELLIQTTHSLISTGTEGICFSRMFAPGTGWERWVKYPFYTGYLNVGRVIALGDGVTGWSVGDRAASRAPHSSHVLRTADTTVHIPDAVSSEDATWMGLGKITQVGVRAADHKLGDAVVVIGLGLLGQLVVQYTRLFGAREVIAIDTAPKRLDMAAAHGATHALKMTAADAVKSVADLTAGKMADVVYDVTGHAPVFPCALGLARRFGTIVLLGDSGTPSQQTLTHDLINKGLRVIGAHDVHPPEQSSDHVPWSAKAIFELFFTYLARGQMRVGDLITHRVKPNDAADVYNMLKTHRDTAMGVLFEWT